MPGINNINLKPDITKSFFEGANFSRKRTELYLGCINEELQEK